MSGRVFVAEAGSEDIKEGVRNFDVDPFRGRFGKKVNFIDRSFVWLAVADDKEETRSNGKIFKLGFCPARVGCEFEASYPFLL